MGGWKAELGAEQSRAGLYPGTSDCPTSSSHTGQNPTTNPSGPYPRTSAPPKARPGHHEGINFHLTPLQHDQVPAHEFLGDIPIQNTNFCSSMNTVTAEMDSPAQCPRHLRALPSGTQPQSCLSLQGHGAHRAGFAPRHASPLRLCIPQSTLFPAQTEHFTVPQIRPLRVLTRVSEEGDDEVRTAIQMGRLRGNPKMNHRGQSPHVTPAHGSGF